MTPLKLAALVRYKTGTDSTSFPDAEILAYAETRLDELAKDIVKVDEDILLTPQYADLVASSTSREYSLPSDILSSIKRVEAKFDGTNLIPLYEFDMTEYSGTLVTESAIVAYFNNYQVSPGNPNGARFMLTRKALTIYSGTITAVTSGLRIWCNTWPTSISDLTSTTDMSVDLSTTTHGIPRELHEILSRGIIIDWKSSRPKPIPLVEKELVYAVDKLDAINSLKPQNRDRIVTGGIPSGATRGDDGYNY